MEMAFIRSVPNTIKDLMPNAMNANVNVYVFFAALSQAEQQIGAFSTPEVFTTRPSSGWMSLLKW